MLAGSRARLSLVSQPSYPRFDIKRMHEKAAVWSSSRTWLNGVGSIQFPCPGNGCTDLANYELVRRGLGMVLRPELQPSNAPQHRFVNFPDRRFGPLDG